MTIFDWKEYLTLAEDLSAGHRPTSTEESRLRAAASRAYYAAFCPARDYLIEINELSPARRDEPALHRKVADCFKRSTDGRRRRIGEWLHAMRDLRNVSDYEEAEIPRIGDAVRESLQRSRWVFELLAKLRAVRGP